MLLEARLAHEGPHEQVQNSLEVTSLGAAVQDVLVSIQADLGEGHSA